jgi:hypothetical protein
MIEVILIWSLCIAVFVFMALCAPEMPDDGRP